MYLLQGVIRAVGTVGVGGKTLLPDLKWRFHKVPNAIKVLEHWRPQIFVPSAVPGHYYKTVTCLKLYENVQFPTKMEVELIDPPLSRAGEILNGADFFQLGALLNFVSNIYP